MKGDGKMDNNNNMEPNINAHQDMENTQVEDRQEKKEGGRNWTALVVVVLLISFMGGFAGAYFGNSYFSNQASPNAYVQDPITISPNDSITAVSAVAKKSMSSVV